MFCKLVHLHSEDDAGTVHLALTLSPRMRGYSRTCTDVKPTLEHAKLPGAELVRSSAGIGNGRVDVDIFFANNMV